MDLEIELPGSGSLSEELHQPPLHLEPDVAGQIEEKGEECEIEGNPLVVRVVDNVLKHLVLGKKTVRLSASVIKIWCSCFKVRCGVRTGYKNKNRREKR